MSSYKRVFETTLLQFGAKPVSRRAMLSIGLAGLGGLTLSACGFRPMYGNASSSSPGGATSAKLALIKIDPIDDRIGQQLHNLLRDRMNPAGQPDKPSYRLGVKLDQQDLVTTNGDNHVRHHALTMTATYWLNPADDEKRYVMESSDSRVIVSYDTLDDPYNDIATINDSQQRAVDQLADMITNRVAAFFSKNLAG
jgi:LPS-assembly lipoprotein